MRYWSDIHTHCYLKTNSKYSWDFLQLGAAQVGTRAWQLCQQGHTPRSRPQCYLLQQSQQLRENFLSKATESSVLHAVTQRQALRWAGLGLRAGWSTLTLVLGRIQGQRTDVAPSPRPPPWWVGTHDA